MMVSTDRLRHLGLSISGDLHTDPATLEKFSKDASSYRIQPKFVVDPKTEEDILKVLKAALWEDRRGILPSLWKYAGIRVRVSGRCR